MWKFLLIINPYLREVLDFLDSLQRKLDHELWRKKFVSRKKPVKQTDKTYYSPPYDKWLGNDD